MAAACHFRLVGGCREQEFSGKIRPYPATSVASTILAATGITVFTTINFTKITVTVTHLTRVLACLIGGGISPCSDVV
jgi:hypothetical protein